MAIEKLTILMKHFSIMCLLLLNILVRNGEVVSQTLLPQGINLQNKVMGGTAGASPHQYEHQSNMGLLALQPFHVLYLSGQIIHGLAELPSVEIGYSHALSPNDKLAIRIQQFSANTYRENSFALGYSRKISSHVGIGVRNSINVVSLSEFGSTAYGLAEVGIAFQANEFLHAGYNVTIPYLVEETIGRAKPHHVFAVSYTPIGDLTLAGGFIVRDRASLHAGLEYLILEQIWITLGYNSLRTISFSVGYRFRDLLGVRVGAEIHPVLGNSPGVSLLYLLNRKNDN